MLCPMLIYGQNRAVYGPKNKKKDAVDFRFRFSREKDITKFKRHIFVSLDGGLNALSAENINYKPSYNARMGIGFQFSPCLSVKASLGYGLLDGDFFNHRKTLIESNYYEATLRLRIDLFTLFGGYNTGRKYNVYPLIGVGQIQSRIKFKNADNTITGIGYEGEGNTAAGGLSGRIVALTYSMGAEVERRLTQRLSLYVDIMTFYADSDRIDGIIIPYSSNDWYVTGNIGINFKILKKD